MPKVITILIIILLFIIALLLLIYPLVKRVYFNRFFKSLYYRKIYRLVMDNDWRLINNFTFALDDKNDATFDHIIFSDKFIYCIVDKYWHGGIIGKSNDDSWIFYPDKKDKCYIDNPLKVNQLRIEKLSLSTGLDPEIFIPIVLINDDCLLDDLKLENNYIVKVSKLKNLIKKNESSDIDCFNQEELQKVVYELNKLKL